MAVVAAAASIVGAFWGKPPDTDAAEKVSAMKNLLEAIANFGDVLIKVSGTFCCVLRIIKKSKQKLSCKYWGFGIRK